jgi:hypothetical protein
MKWSWGYKNIAFFFFCIINFQGLTQNSLSPETIQLTKDLTYLKEVLYTSHPATFEYISKDSLDHLFDSLQFDLKEGATTLKLEKKVRFILSKIGCIHTSIKNSVVKESNKRIPFKMYAVGNDLWIEKDKENRLNMVNNYRVLAINGNTSQTIISKMKAYRASDGYNETFKYELINNEKWFNNVYQYYFDSDSIRTYTIVSNEFDTTTVKRKNSNEITVLKKNVAIKKTHYGKNISVAFMPSQKVAVLNIESFSDSPIWGKVINKKRYKKALDLIDNEGYTNLVIDLRNNTGGDAASGYSLLSFFVQENHYVSIKKHKGKIFKYAVPVSKVNSIANFMVGNLFSSRNFTCQARASKAKVKKSSNYTYEGDVFVVINGFTLSTASNVASLFKYKTKATIVGIESGGGENNLNAYFFPIIKLPYSKMKIQIPQYKIDLRLVKNTGSGVIPDVKVIYSLQDVIAKKDIELKKIIEMVSVK